MHISISINYVIADFGTVAHIFHLLLLDISNRLLYEICGNNNNKSMSYIISLCPSEPVLRQEILRRLDPTALPWVTPAFFQGACLLVWIQLLIWEHDRGIASVIIIQKVIYLAGQCPHFSHQSMYFPSKLGSWSNRGMNIPIHKRILLKSRISRVNSPHQTVLCEIA